MATNSNPGADYQRLNNGLSVGTVEGAVPFDYNTSQKAAHALNMKTQFIAAGYIQRLRLAGR